MSAKSLLSAAAFAATMPLAFAAAWGADDEVLITGYRPGDATSASKTDIPVLENVQAISVVTEDLLKDQGITRLADALRNVAGVSRASTYGFFDAYQIRGYDAAYGSLFLDGLKNGNFAGESHELGGLERVEVLKGPASGLYGAAPLGGVVNLVSKRPKRGDFLNATLGTGSYDNVNAALDANGELTSAGNLLGRLNVVYRDHDEFVRFSHVERVYVAPALTWEITPDTDLTLLTRYQRDKTNPWAPVPAYGTILPNPHGELPIDFNVGDDNQRAVYDQSSTQAGYALIHRFNENVSVSQNLRYERTQDDWKNWLFAAGIDADQATIGRYYYGPTHSISNDLGVDTRVDLKIATGPLRHAVLIGFDYTRQNNTYHDAGVFDQTMNPIDLFDPNYSVPLYTIPDYIGGSSSRLKQRGVYLQDHLAVGDRLTVTLGGRWDRTHTDEQRDRAFSPTVGATWSLTPEAALYATVAKSFTPTPSWQTSFDNSLLPPERGRNIEAGVKLVSRDGVLNGMLSVFQLTRTNVATDDLEHFGYYTVTGEQRSRGVEVEGAWRPSSAWQLRAAYSYIDAQVTKDNSLPVGIPLANVPRNNVNLWSKYIVQSGPLARLGISAGFLRNSDKHFYELGSGLYTLPAYNLFDAGLSYAFSGWDTQFQVNNLLDKRHYTDAYGLDRVTAGEPRNWELSISRAF
jgi:iron complex outermembrane receptor protein